jgi:hypothetical protein
VSGCDSVVTLNLTINATPSTPSVNVVNNCNGTSTLSTTASGTLLWSNAATTSPITVSSAGTYTVTTTVNGCESAAGSGEAAPKTSNTGDTTATACGSFIWYGNTYTSSATPTHTFTNVSGCDSVVTLHLTIKQPTTSTETISSCGSYNWNGNTYTSGMGASAILAKWTIPTAIASGTTGTNYSHGVANSGVNTTGSSLGVVHSLSATTFSSLSGNGSPYSISCNNWSSGDYYQATVSTLGYTNITFSWDQTRSSTGPATFDLKMSIDGGSSFTTVLAGYTVIQAGLAGTGTTSWSTTTLQSQFTNNVNLGATAANTSSVILRLVSTVTPTAAGTNRIDNFSIDGNPLLPGSGTYTYTTTNAAGCDSIATLNLTLLNGSPTTSTATISACDSYLWHGTTYTVSNNTATWTGTNAAGCDSVVTLNLTINATPATPTVNVVNNCNGTSTLSTTASGTLLWSTAATTSPITVSSAGTYTVTTTVNGCVSAAGSGEAAPKTSNTGDSTATACVSFVWYGNTYTSSATPTHTFTNVSGCDSVVTLHLTINQATTSTNTQTATGSYSWNGNSYTSSGVYTYHTNNAVGCDSAATLSLTINAVAINNVTNVCTYIGINQTLTYTASVAGASSYAWTLPSNTQLISGQGTRSIVVKFLNGFASQANKQIRVTPAAGSLQIIYLLAQAPVTPSIIIASTSNICNSIGTSTPVTFTIPKVLAAVSYIWTAQNGTTNITHPNGVGENDTTVAITIASNFTSSNVSVQTVNTCGVSGSRSYLLSFNTPTQPSLISGPTNTCEYIGDAAQVATYSLSADATVTSYAWTLPQGAIGLTGQGTSTISFKYPAGYTGGSISVTTTNGCGTSPSRSLTVSRLSPATPGNIDVINTQSCPNRVYTYSIASLPANATSLLWTIPDGATLVSGQGSRSITVSYPSGVVDGYVTVKSVANCGLSSAKKSQVKMAPCPVNPSPGFTKGSVTTTPSTMDVKVFPNPTTSSFNLQVNTNNNKEVSVKIMDIQGRVIKSFATTTFQINNIGYELTAGVYMVEVLNGEEKKVVRVVKY